MELINYLLSNVAATDNYTLYIIIAILVAEVVVRLTPTEKDNSILNSVLLNAIKILDLLVPNKAATATGEKSRFSLKAFITKIKK